MHIVFITHFFPPARSAGTENYTLGLARAFLSRGHEVSVVCAGDWEVGPAYWNGVSEESFNGIQVHRINLNWKKARDPNLAIFESPEVERWMMSFLGTTRPDIVHVTSTMTLGIGVLRAAFNADIPLVTTLMDFWFICPRTILVTGDGRLCDGVTTAWECMRCLLTTSRLYGHSRNVIPERFQEPLWRGVSRNPIISRIRGIRGMAIDVERRKASLPAALELSDVILSHSRFVKEMHRRTGVSDRIKYLPNGHDTSWLKGFSVKNESSVMRYGYMGQIVPAKGVHVLIEAFQRAKFDGGIARLDIWGDLKKDGAYTERLHNQIGTTKAVHLRGLFNRPQLVEVLAEIDVLVVPSLWYENAPLVIYEAFATNTPVIATDLGGMAEAVRHEEDGLLFERGDADHLRRQMQRVINEPDLLRRLQAGIPPVKEIYDEVLELEAIYLQLIDKE